MKLWQKIGSLLLVACLLVAVLPMRTQAAQLPQTTHHKEFQGLRKGTCNGLYLKEDLAPLSGERSSYLGFYDAAAVLRDGMKEHDNSIDVYFKCSTSYAYPDCIYDLVDEAYAHTGVPDEGDYLRWQDDGWECSISHSSSGGVDYYSLTFYIDYFTTSSQEAQVDSAVDELLDELDLYDATDYDKIRGCYDWICENVTYDYDHGSSYLLKHSAYAAIIDRTAVCQGIALLMYRLMLELDVDCRLISGDGGGPHGWNIVQLDGFYYNVDATWDLGLSPMYQWFLLSQSDFVNHYRDDEYTTSAFMAEYPMATNSYVVSDVFSGSCGNDLTWNLSSDGTLTISGTGKMTDFTDEYVPWMDYLTSILRVEIEYGVTSIGDYAFDGCYNMTELEIPDSVTSIGEWAFFYCISLDSLTIPHSVTIIDDYAFQKCHGLTAVTIGSGLSYFGAGAFSWCENLTTVTVEDGVTHIGYSAFWGCSNLREIYFQGDAPGIGNYAFDGVNATVYYPAGNATWTSSVMQNYGGSINWVAYEVANTVTGDVNGDGNVNYLDAMLIAQFYVGDIGVNSLDVDAADANGDGQVNYLDAMLVAQYYVGDIDAFPTAN